MGYLIKVHVEVLCIAILTTLEPAQGLHLQIGLGNGIVEFIVPLDTV